MVATHLLHNLRVVDFNRRYNLSGYSLRKPYHFFQKSFYYHFLLTPFKNPSHYAS